MNNKHLQPLLSLRLRVNKCFSANKKQPVQGLFFVGCFTWIRTKINGVRVRCPTIRR